MPDAEQPPLAGEPDPEASQARAAREQANAEAVVAQAEETAATAAAEHPRAKGEPGPAAHTATVNDQVLGSISAAMDFASASGGAIGRVAFAELLAQAAGLAMLNAVNAQQNAYVAANATTLAAVSRMLTLRLDPREARPDE